jgi:hypothetical protein
MRERNSFPDACRPKAFAVEDVARKGVRIKISRFGGTGAIRPAPSVSS